MKTIIVITMAILLAACFAYCAGAEQYEIYTDYNGILAAGSRCNPYIIRDGLNEVGRFYTDESYSPSSPLGQIYKPGSQLNPWIFEAN